MLIPPTSDRSVGNDRMIVCVEKSLKNQDKFDGIREDKRSAGGFVEKL